jgi:hypothetical protein
MNRLQGTVSVLDVLQIHRITRETREITEVSHDFRPLRDTAVATANRVVLMVEKEKITRENEVELEVHPKPRLTEGPLTVARRHGAHRAIVPQRLDAHRAEPQIYREDLPMGTVTKPRDHLHPAIDRLQKIQKAQVKRTEALEGRQKIRRQSGSACW